MKSPVKFLSEVKKEMGMVTWPTKMETAQTTFLVLLLSLISGVFFFCSDLICSHFIRFVLM